MRDEDTKIATATITQVDDKTSIISLPNAGASKYRADPDPAIKHFRPLGHYRDKFFFLTSRGGQVLAFGHTKLAAKATLFMLAPLQWWEREFPNDSGFSGKAVDQAVNFLISRCYRAGVFRVERMRGRGAWMDDGRAVVHAGDRLYIDGVETPLTEFQSRYVYEALPSLPVDMNSPLSVDGAQQFFRLCTKLNWEQPLYGTLLAGWATIAMVCGCMSWRPHLFLTGPSGCGKSWIMQQVQRLLGDFVLAAKGETTEAGLRQALVHDALPVTMDEAEGEDSRTAANMERILGLMRQSSAEIDGNIIKGGQDGVAASYTVRSMFLLSAIRVPMRQTADETRVTVLTLRRNGAVDHQVFAEEIYPLAMTIADDEYARSFRARVFSLLPVLRSNIKTFCAAAGMHFGNPRIGDQIGPLSAGAYLLHSDNEIDINMARDWLSQQSWPDQEQMADESDEEKCLTALLEAKIFVQGEHIRYDLSIGELIARASGAQVAYEVSITAAREALGRSGMLVGGGWLTVSNTHREIGRLLRDTSWGVGWGRIFKRIDGAKAANGRPYFGGARSRATLVPMRVIEDKGQFFV